MQFAAVVVDDNFKVINTVDFRARPNWFTVPAPGAMVAQGRRFGEIEAHLLSQHELGHRIAMFETTCRPALWIGYNSIRFDDEFLRHSWYRNLRSTYRTQTNGKGRGDVLSAVRPCLSRKRSIARSRRWTELITERLPCTATRVWQSALETLQVDPDAKVPG